MGLVRLQDQQNQNKTCKVGKCIQIWFLYAQLIFLLQIWGGLGSYALILSRSHSGILTYCSTVASKDIASKGLLEGSDKELSLLKAMGLLKPQMGNSLS